PPTRRPACAASACSPSSRPGRAGRPAPAGNAGSPQNSPTYAPRSPGGSSGTGSTPRRDERSPVPVRFWSVPASAPGPSGEGGDQQGERGDDDGDTDVVVPAPAAQLLLPVRGPVLGGPGLVPVADRHEQQHRHRHAEEQQPGGHDPEWGAGPVPRGYGPDGAEDERAPLPEGHQGAEQPAPVGVALLAAVPGERVEDAAHHDGDGELHP